MKGSCEGVTPSEGPIVHVENHCCSEISRACLPRSLAQIHLRRSVMDIYPLEDRQALAYSHQQSM